MILGHSDFSSINVDNLCNEIPYVLHRLFPAIAKVKSVKHKMYRHSLELSIVCKSTDATCLHNVGDAIIGDCINNGMLPADSKVMFNNVSCSKFVQRITFTVEMGGSLC